MLAWFNPLESIFVTICRSAWCTRHEGVPKGLRSGQCLAGKQLSSVGQIPRHCVAPRFRRLDRNPPPSQVPLERVAPVKDSYSNAAALHCSGVRCHTKAPHLPQHAGFYYEHIIEFCLMLTSNVMGMQCLDCRPVKPHGPTGKSPFKGVDCTTRHGVAIEQMLEHSAFNHLGITGVNTLSTQKIPALQIAA